MPIDVFESAVHSRYGAVFERDDETAYFYLVDAHDERILAALAVEELTRRPADLLMRIAWSPSGDRCGLYADGELIAVFELKIGPGGTSFEGRLAKPDDRSHFLDS